jgi:formylglycine-generating enzyme required for sulfatase activity
LDYTEIKYPFEQIPYEKDLALDDARTWRGGAFNNLRRNVRAALRFNYVPVNRVIGIGFRVVEHLLRS